MALAAVPVFFLARRILSRGWSLGIAALSVAMPWMLYASRSLTEPLFYVLFAVSRWSSCACSSGRPGGGSSSFS